MTHRRFFAAAAMALLAAPAWALVASAPVPADGITPAEVAQLMSLHHMAPKPGQGSGGNPVIDGQVAGTGFDLPGVRLGNAGVGFDIRLSDCHDGHCRDLQFEVGWSKAEPPAVTLDKINAWNVTHRFLRAYLTADHTLWATMDARIARGTTANIEEYLALWPAMVNEFRSYFRL